MNFNITDCDYKKIYPGQIIQYTVTPLLNIPLKWVTEITHVVDKKYFVDEQDLDHTAFGTTNIL